MFNDPISIAATAATPLLLPRVDAGPKSGRFTSVSPGVSIEDLNIRNTEYMSKKDKRIMFRHNVELSRSIVIAATTTSPEATKVLKGYVVIEHDSRATLAEIQLLADQLANFFIAAKNPGFVQKLVNNEG